MTDLFMRHKGTVCTLANSYFPNNADAEDAMQEAYIKLSSVTITDPENEEALVYVIVRNLFRDIYGKAKRMMELDQQAAIIEDYDDNDPLTTVMALSEDNEFSRRLDDLPDNLTLVAKLYYINGYSYKQVADELDIPEGTVASRLNAVRRYFQGYLI